MQRITIEPDPPRQGQPLTICYDFTDLPDDASVDLEITWEPDTITDPSGVTVTPGQHCSTITVPDNAIGIVISGPNTEDLARNVGI